MSKTSEDYNWAAAVLALAEEPSSDLAKLVQATQLDPKAGDLADIDMSGLDLRGADLSGWDLQHAKLAGALLVGADFTDAKVDPVELVQAEGWQDAKLDTETRFEAELQSLMQSPIEVLDLSHSTVRELHSLSILSVGEIPSNSKKPVPIGARANAALLDAEKAAMDRIQQLKNKFAGGTFLGDIKPSNLLRAARIDSPPNWELLK